VAGDRRVSVGGLPERIHDWAVVVVDVLRATTVLCTATWLGRSCLVAATAEEARSLVAATPGALLAGEQGGRVPPGFDLGNSPVEWARRTDVERPMVLVTSSGTPLLCAASHAGVAFAACLRNVTAQVERLLSLNHDVAIIPAGTGGRPREEDDLCAAYLAAGLLDAGFHADGATAEHVSEWARRPVSVCADGASAEFLRQAGSADDLDFVLSHVDDLVAAFPIRGPGLACEPVR
jgi:2-phosphosulfolactate phosphatase